MTTPQLQEQIAAARAYEDLFVPALFRQWTPLLAKVAHVGPGKRVLDVACGTGILARELAAQVGTSGSVAGLDLMPGMVEVAKQIAPNIEWKQGTADELPFPDQSFDVVVSQFGLMFFPDRTKSLREMLRVLSPGGAWPWRSGIPWTISLQSPLRLLFWSALQGERQRMRFARRSCLETRLN